MIKKIFLFTFLLIFASTATAAPVVLGIAAGFVAGAVGVTVGTAIAIGLGVASLTYALSMKVPSPSRSQQEVKQLLRSSRSPKSVVYGRTFVSGALLFAEEEQGDTANNEGIFEEDLYMAVGICDHPIENIDSVFLNETPIGEFGAKASYQLHNNDTTVDQVLLDNAPSWRDDMIGRGTTWARLVLTYDRELYANGVPTPRFTVRGKRVFDPRDGQMKFTSNAALIIFDFFTEYMGVPRDRMITSGFGSFIDAANLCDENVTNPDGTNNPRYTINGVFALDEKPTTALTDMLNACAGQLVRQAGQIGLLPGAFYGPATFTLTESDVLGDVTIIPEPEYRNAANTIKGTFIDPEQNWVETDFPPVIDTGARTRDGGELTHDMKFRFITNAYQAQRVASITLRRGLAGGSVSLRTNLRGLYCRVGRVISLDLPTIGITGTYRVLSQSSHLSDGVELELARDVASLYDDAVGQPFVSPPLTNIPLQGVRPPSALQFSVEQIGEVIQGVIGWRINDGQSASTDIRFRRASDQVTVRTDNINGNSYNVNGLPANAYIVEVRTVSTLGFVSNWVSASFSVVVPPAPTSVTVTQSNWNIMLIPVISGGVPSGTLFEFRHIQDTASFITGVPTYDADDINVAIPVFTGSTFNHGGLFPDRYQHYWVRSTSVYGQSDWLYVRTGTTKESDLVTTVVERLIAIEVQSQNWVPDSNGLSPTGYKLFSNATPGPLTLPNGTVLNQLDGLAVFQNAIVRGGVYGDYGELNNITIRENCTVLGTIEAGQIVGDIVSAITKVNAPVTVSTTSTGWLFGPNFGSITVVNPRNRARTLQISLALNVGFNSGEAFAIAAGRVVVTGSFGTLISQEIHTPAKPGDSEDTNANTLIVLSIPIPANTNGTLNIRVDARRVTSSRAGNVFATLSSSTTNNQWSALLLTNGGDLS